MKMFRKHIGQIKQLKIDAGKPPVAPTKPNDYDTNIVAKNKLHVNSAHISAAGLVDLKNGS